MQTPRFMWCGDGQVHEEFAERSNTTSIPTYCNCKLVEEEEPHPWKYQGAATLGTRCKNGNLRERSRLQRKAVIFHSHRPWTVLHGDAAQQQTARAAVSSAPSCTGLSTHSAINECSIPLEAQLTSTKSVNSDFYVNSSINGILKNHDRAQRNRIRINRPKNSKKMYTAEYESEKCQTRPLARKISRRRDMTSPNSNKSWSWS
jgi:hypothetical protein